MTTFMKKLLNTSHISDWLVSRLSFSSNIISDSKLQPLLVRKGLIVGQKSHNISVDRHWLHR
jgi:hypothetical protein